MDAPELQLKLQELAVLWTEAEAKLAALKPVVPAEYDVPKSKNKDVLGFRKLGDKWRICVLYDDEWRPIVDCPIHDRVEFVDHLSGLHKKVIAVSEKTLARVKAAIGHLQTALGKLQSDNQSRTPGTKRSSPSKTAPLRGRVLRRKNRM